MNQFSGLKLLEEREGEGQPAQKGDRLVYNIRVFLNKGDEVPLNEIQAKHLPAEMVRVEGGVRFVSHNQSYSDGARRLVESSRHCRV